MTDQTSNNPYNTAATGGQTPGTQGGGTGFTGDTAYPDTPVASTSETWRDDAATTDRDAYGPGGTGTSDPSTSDPSTKDVAKEEASNVKGQAVDSGKQVAATAKDEAAGVAQDAKREARQVLDSGLTEVRTQAGAQQQRAAAGVQSLGRELTSMANNSEGNGVASKLAGDLGRQVEDIGSWLENREPADILQEVQRFARRRPAAFLGICAGAGLLLGRMARGLQADRADDRDNYSRAYDNRGGADQRHSTRGAGAYQAYGDQGYSTQSYDDRYARRDEDATPTTGTLGETGGRVDDSYGSDLAAGGRADETGRTQNTFGNDTDPGTTWTNEGERR